MKSIKKSLSIIILMILCLSILGCNNQKNNASNDNDKKNESNAENESTSTQKDLLSGKHHVTIEISNYGTIYAELDADVAPITVTNFINLSKEGFYDGLTFHRVVEGFMIQGGDPNKNGTGGSEEKIKGEFKANGITNNLSHKRGTISMARNSSSNDSASSQFFIMQKDNTSLDGNYAAFGTVTEGMEIVDKIVQDTKKLTNANGLISITSKQPVITTIRVID